MGSYFTSLLERPCFLECVVPGLFQTLLLPGGVGHPHTGLWSCGCRGLKVLGALQFFGFIGRPEYGG